MKGFFDQAHGRDVQSYLSPVYGHSMAVNIVFLRVLRKATEGRKNHTSEIYFKKHLQIPHSLTESSSLISNIQTKNIPLTKSGRKSIKFIL